MTSLEPTIRVNVDPANPGQFFACCGLLELADRLWDGAQGWFADGSFLIISGGTLIDVLRAIVAANAEEVTRLANGLEVKPLIAPLRLSLDGPSRFNLTIDFWMRVKVEKRAVVVAPNPPWNLWSGRQTSFRIWRDLRKALGAQLPTMGTNQLGELFVDRIPLSGRFGFDPGAAWNALDVGFSPNEQRMDVASSAAVELLAAVGIQRFRPALRDDPQSFGYATWGQPLHPSVAAAAAGDAISVSPTKRFLGRVVSRGSYSALGRSTPYRGDARE